MHPYGESPLAVLGDGSSGPRTGRRIRVGTHTGLRAVPGGYMVRPKDLVESHEVGTLVSAHCRGEVRGF